MDEDWLERDVARAEGLGMGPVASAGGVLVPVRRDGAAGSVECWHVRHDKAWPDGDLITATCLDCGATQSWPRCTGTALTTGARCRRAAGRDNKHCDQHVPGRKTVDPSALVDDVETGAVFKPGTSGGRCLVKRKDGTRCTTGRITANDDDPKIGGMCMLHARWAKNGRRYQRLTEEQWAALT